MAIESINPDRHSFTLRYSDRESVELFPVVRNRQGDPISWSHLKGDGLKAGLTKIAQMMDGHSNPEALQTLTFDGTRLLLKEGETPAAPISDNGAELETLFAQFGERLNPRPVSPPPAPTPLRRAAPLAPSTVTGIDRARGDFRCFAIASLQTIFHSYGYLFEDHADLFEELEGEEGDEVAEEQLVLREQLLAAYGAYKAALENHETMDIAPVEAVIAALQPLANRQLDQYDFSDPEIFADASEFYGRLFNHALAPVINGLGDPAIATDLLSMLDRALAIPTPSLPLPEQQQSFLARWLGPKVEIPSVQSLLDTALEKRDVAPLSRRRDHLPRVLSLKLDRLTELRQSKAPVRVDDTIQIPLQNGDIVSYKLTSVIALEGDDNTSGHNTAYILDGENWKYLNDDTVETIGRLNQDPSVMRHAYLLHYEKVTPPRPVGEVYRHQLMGHFFA